MPEGEDAAQMNAEAIEAHNRKMIEDAKIFFNVFSQGQGPELLEWLSERTVDVPLVQVSGSLANNQISLSPADWAYFREGQNSIIRLIKQQMKLATETAEEPKNKDE